MLEFLLLKTWLNVVGHLKGLPDRGILRCPFTGWRASKTKKLKSGSKNRLGLKFKKKKKNCLTPGLFLNPVPVPRFGKINFFPALFFPPSLLRFRGSQGLRGAREKIPRVWMRPLMQNNQFLGREKKGGEGCRIQNGPPPSPSPPVVERKYLGEVGC